MLGPTADIIATFTNLVTDFNDVYNTGDYAPWANAYLYHPDHKLLINRVDDPGKYVSGAISDIITYFNNYQRPTKKEQPKNDYFPQFSKSASPQKKTHTDKDGDLVGEVTPSPGTNGVYYDTYDKYLAGNGITVHYTLRFKHKNKIWYLCTALVVPV